MDVPNFPHLVVHVRLESAAPFEVGIDTQTYNADHDIVVYVRAGVPGRWLTWRGPGDNDTGDGLYVHNNAKVFGDMGLGSHFI